MFSKQLMFIGGAILFALVLFLIFPSKLPLSSINLDHLMSEKDLSSRRFSNESSLLKNHLGQNFAIKKIDNYHCVEDLYVSQNLGKGQYIQTSNGIYYEVAPYDIRFAAYWATPFPICIWRSDDDADYPFLITDYYTGTNIHVREIEYDEIIERMKALEPPKELQPPPQPEHEFPLQPDLTPPQAAPATPPPPQRGVPPKTPAAPQPSKPRSP